MLKEEAVILNLRKVIGIAERCVEGMSPEFQVVAFGAILEWLLSETDPWEEQE